MLTFDLKIQYIARQHQINKFNRARGRCMEVSPALFSISEGGRMSSNLLQKQPFQDEYWSFPLILANYYVSFSTEIGVVATCEVNKCKAELKK